MMRGLKIAKLLIDFMKSKPREPKYVKGFCNTQIPYYTYLVEAARFSDDFHQPPTIVPVQVRLSDDDYIHLLRWQINNPTTGFNACVGDLCDIVGSIECQVEDALYGDDEPGTYAIYLTEVRNDVALLQKQIEEIDNK